MKINNADSICGEYFDEIEKNNTSHEFANNLDNFSEDNKSKNNTLKSAEGSTKEKTLVESYLLEGQVTTKDFKNSKNFISKSSFNTNDSSNENKIINFNKMPKKFDNFPKNEIFDKEKLLDLPSLLIMEILVGNKMYAVYQELENYTFFLKLCSLKRIKNRFNFIGGVKIINYPYLNNKNGSYYYYFFFDYLPSLIGFRLPNYLFNRQKRPKQFYYYQLKSA